MDDQTYNDDLTYNHIILSYLLSGTLRIIKTTLIIKLIYSSAHISATFNVLKIIRPASKTVQIIGANHWRPGASVELSPAGHAPLSRS